MRSNTQPRATCPVKKMPLRDEDAVRLAGGVSCVGVCLADERAVRMLGTFQDFTCRVAKTL
jgi:hypothetical protein